MHTFSFLGLIVVSTICTSVNSPTVNETYSSLKGMYPPSLTTYCCRQTLTNLTKGWRQLWQVLYIRIIKKYDCSKGYNNIRIEETEFVLCLNIIQVKQVVYLVYPAASNIWRYIISCVLQKHCVTLHHLWLHKPLTKTCQHFAN